MPAESRPERKSRARGRGAAKRPRCRALAASQTNMMPFVAAAVFYYIFNLVVAVAMEWIEKKLDYYR